ncbi:TPA: SDR family oxidoreductase [Klebsiella aerogenes]|nr:SDR family oxidoreductase [Klebsiella aerogenes]
MRVFLTGASGFIGSRILTELLTAGHQVTGLARSENSAQVLKKAGADVHRGTLEGSDRPFIITSGTGIGDDGDTALAREDQFKPDNMNPRVASEIEGNALLAEGVNVRVVRLPQVHDTTRQGLITGYIQNAVEKGAVACIGEGDNRWSAAHVSDVARLYRLVLEHGENGKRYHGVAEEGVSLRQIAEVVAGKLRLPLISITPSEAQTHFGWFAMFAAMNLRASSAWTRQQLGWHPTGPSLTDDLQNMDYTSFLSSQ